ncbi:discoidin domain-containing protein [Chryseobacterium sp. S0630]|uniref:discoidin domain-containing protein n=1 Tax=Chryseobacterium sp. S0630 TaxID=2957803 RepID=UPI00209D218E|nr:discoidin domain-containing protein [Chryseobacterium sp. S0630]MCP1302153.1 discoidin domain-containing protein [Chryseobacterium sp. S0630]
MNVHRKKQYISAIVLVLLMVWQNVYAQTGPNIALNKPVTASTTVITNPSLSALTDGNLTTWTGTDNATVPGSAEWLQIDLGADQWIEHVKISSRPGQHNRGRRFMIITFPDALGPNGLGGIPDNYITAASSSSYNRIAYTNAAAVGGAGNLLLGGTVPGASGSNLGPDYVTRTMNVGIHKARYIRILTLQDDYLDLAEVEVYKTATPAQRGLVNGNLEAGYAGGGIGYVQEAGFPGWSTTELVAMVGGITNPDNGGLFEIWRSGNSGVPANQGLYFAELNAYSNGQLEQPVCVLSGEVFNWSFAHRGRLGVDVMRLRINDVDIAEFTDNNAATGTHTGTVLTPSTTTITSRVNEGNGWYQYSGTWTNTTGTSLVATFAFRAVSSAGGSTGAGNFIDDLSVTSLSALGSFASGTTYSGGEDVPNANLPKLLVNGTIPAGGATLELNLSGTATRGIDYTTTPATGPIIVTIPQGTYDGTAATGISLAPYIHVYTDALAEGPETIIMNLQNPNGMAIDNGQGCSGNSTAQMTYTILDLPFCYHYPAITAGAAQETKYGISSLGRAGTDNGNWPMVRKGAWVALEAKTKGFVINRLTTVQKNTLIPVEGMMVYDVNLDCLSIYDGSAWWCFTTQGCPPN